jgi:hypothetical protein
MKHMISFLTNLLFNGVSEPAPRTIGGARIAARTYVIDSVMKDMGYTNGYDNYAENIADIEKTGRYVEFERRMEERSRENGV